ncbi:RNA polymerase sigma-70 factor, ECF subfamily [Micrococcales bacterium KH10]|nr:RNA polymerase sigma-70 factor, ECF subfamily [Micrococcales bacterium KH10]
MAAWDEVMTQVLTQYGASLYAYGRAVTGNKAEAEDLVHDAVVRVFSRMTSRTGAPKGRTGRRLSSTALPSTVAAYLRRTMLTIYIDGARRKQRWRSIGFRASLPEEVPDHADAVAARGVMSRALAHLTPMQRACILFYYYEDLTSAQVADELGLAHGTVRRHLHDALARLREGELVPHDAAIPTNAGEKSHG